MPKFMKVATTDELEDQQAKLVEVEGQKIGPLSGGTSLPRAEQYVHPSRRAAVRRDGRGSRLGNPERDRRPVKGSPWPRHTERPKIAMPPR
jgi:hypothetical protein